MISMKTLKITTDYKTQNVKISVIVNESDSCIINIEAEKIKTLLLVLEYNPAKHKAENETNKRGLCYHEEIYRRKLEKSIHNKTVDTFERRNQRGQALKW